MPRGRHGRGASVVWGRDELGGAPGQALTVEAIIVDYQALGDQGRFLREKFGRSDLVL